ncbi:FadR/GntR family transcriptional regulator [Vannielia litorea]|uniref:FadR/GntR family transcriptional regulator n=1 Tax=Vannielia litorea TaxID=1217970 RepID=UPI001BCEA2AC|nr:FCD domain-containing protein [Vannielia litorea]MBS8227200.1 FadR family transcriptional regulator [Vannielia litorea]
MVRNLSRRSSWLNRLAEEVARALTARIADGTLAEGDEIVDRDAIAGEFITSPGVVDRALQMLVAEGLLRQEEGGGLVVASPPTAPRTFELPENFGATRQDVLAVMELRMGVEVVAAALAAERRDDAQMAAILAARQGFEETVAESAGMAQADFRLHHAIAAASANPYILEMLEYLGPLLMPRMRLDLPVSARDGDERHLQAAMAEHAAIVTAIEIRNPEEARVAMRGHLSRSIEFLRGLTGA